MVVVAEAPLTLDHMRAGSRGRVASIRGDGQIRRRLLEMGLCPGTELQLIRRAPLGDPIELKIRGYLLSVRGDHARHVVIDQAPG
jgi:Fe2+ transport system protein FeoA